MLAESEKKIEAVTDELKNAKLRLKDIESDVISLARDLHEV